MNNKFFNKVKPLKNKNSIPIVAIFLNILTLIVLFYFSYLFLKFDLGGSPIRFTVGELLFIPLIENNQIRFYFLLLFFQLIILLPILYISKVDFGRFSLIKIILSYITSLIVLVLIGVLTILTVFAQN